MKTAEQISKIFARGNHLNVPIVRKVSDSIPNPRGADPRPSNMKNRREGHLVLKSKLKWVTPEPYLSVDGAEMEIYTFTDN